MTANIVLASESTHLLTVARQCVESSGGATCRPWNVSHPTLEAIMTAMRSAGREELVHYAGACYRDEVAWRVSLAWLALPEQPESELKAIALNQTYGWNLTGEDIRRNNPDAVIVVRNVEPVTDWGALDCIAVYDERKRLANTDPDHEYFVEERLGKVYPMRDYRIVRRTR